MSNKDFNLLNELDKKLRNNFKVGMTTPNVRVTIELINGFELFNTRPYHNHEDWSDGYRITDHETGVKYEAEDLDDAVNGFVNKVRDAKMKKVLDERFKDRPKKDIMDSDYLIQALDEKL